MTVGQRIFELLKQKDMTQKEYVVIPQNTEERLLIEVFVKMDFEERKQLLAYAKKILEH